jgi:regulator of sirC expression with transglutaminase-like and TPR domain
MNSETKIREIKALISLVDEPDVSIYVDIARRILNFGQQAIPFLEQEWEKNLDPRVQKRLESLIHDIQFESIETEFNHWVKTGCINLLDGWMILTRYQYPLLDESLVHYEISQIRKDIWLEINDNLTALEQVKVFNHVFYNIHGFKGNTDDYHSPENSFLNKVLQTRRGNPLSLSIIYLTLAQSIDMPVFGINLPEHFVLAYTGNTFNPDSLTMDRQTVLFYINAFNKGTVFSKKDIDEFISQLNLQPQSSYFEPCTNQEIIHRMINNLIIAYQGEEKIDKVNEMIILRGILMNIPS